MSKFDIRNTHRNELIKAGNTTSLYNITISIHNKLKLI